MRGTLGLLVPGPVDYVPGQYEGYIGVISARPVDYVPGQYEGYIGVVSARSCGLRTWPV